MMSCSVITPAVIIFCRMPRLDLLLVTGQELREDLPDAVADFVACHVLSEHPASDSRRQH